MCAHGHLETTATFVYVKTAQTMSGHDKAGSCPVDPHSNNASRGGRCKIDEIDPDGGSGLLARETAIAMLEPYQWLFGASTSCVLLPMNCCFRHPAVAQCCAAAWQLSKNH
jgi:hypothetical protein